MNNDYSFRQKIEKLKGKTNQQQNRIIFNWVKAGDINVKQFAYIIELIRG